MKQWLERLAWYTIPSKKRYYICECVEILSVHHKNPSIQYHVLEKENIVTFALPVIMPNNDHLIIFIHMDVPLNGTFCAFSVRYSDDKNRDCGLKFRYNPPTWWPRFRPPVKYGIYSTADNPFFELISQYITKYRRKSQESS